MQARRLRTCNFCVLREHTATELVEEHRVEVDDIVWPTDEGMQPLHVKVLREDASIDREQVPDYTKSFVFINDTYRRALRNGVVPLCGEDQWRDHRDDPKMLFTMLDEFRFMSPGYVQLLPPVSKGDTRRLWLTNFGMTIRGCVIGVDVSGRLPARRCRASFVWPNAVEFVEAGFFSGINSPSILVADGFLVPGKTKGNVWLVTDPGGEDEVAVQLLPSKSSWFYHKAVPLNLSGHEGVLTSRARMPIFPFSKPEGELVWIEKPRVLNPMASWNLPWREVVLADGPDVIFEVVDLDEEDSTVEVFAAEFFARRLTMHSLGWDDDKGVPVVVERQVIDDSLGQAYSVSIADLQGNKSHLLVTTHEYAADPTLGRSGPLYWIPGINTKWTYTESNAPKGSRGISGPNGTVGGSLFAYRIPRNWRTYRVSSALTEERFSLRLPELFRSLDPDADKMVGAPKVEHMIRSMGFLPVPSESRDAAGGGDGGGLERLVGDANWDGNGRLDFDQFRGLMLGLFRSSRRGTNLLVQARKLLQFAMGEGIKNLEAAIVSLDAKSFQSRLPEVFGQIDSDASGAIDMDEMKQAMLSMGVTCSDVELAAMFVEADWDENGLIEYVEFENLMLRLFFGVRGTGANIFATALNRLEGALKHTAAAAESEVVHWQRSVLASGFRVKRASINPGAPGFAYPFYPHASMRERGLPPHIMLAGDCADAAYVFRPLHAPDAERPEYDLLATLAFEGTVGSVAVGHVDIEASVDDGWAKFFAPVYETNRVYIFKCGAPPTLGVEPEW